MGSPKRRESRPPHRAAKRKRGGFPLLPLLLILVLAGGAVYLFLFGPPWVREPVTFQYRDITLEALEGVPVNRYDPAGFSVDERGRVRYRQGLAEARTGIDVSYYQGEIDWAAVAADGIDFAILRLGYRGYSEGELFLDSRFTENLAGAAAAGLELGVYFFSQALTPQEAEEEAAFVLEALDGRPLDYPVAFDWEPISPGKSARTDGLDGETLTRCAVAFCERIAQGGYEPAVYLNREQAYLIYDLSQLAELPLWLADYRTATDFFYGFDLWQYSHTGAVEGIRTTVDLDLDLRPARG